MSGFLIAVGGRYAEYNASRQGLDAYGAGISRHATPFTKATAERLVQFLKANPFPVGAHTDDAVTMIPDLTMRAPLEIAMPSPDIDAPTVQWCPRCGTREVSPHYLPYCSRVCEEAEERNR